MANVATIGGREATLMRRVPEVDDARTSFFPDSGIIMTLMARASYQDTFIGSEESFFERDLRHNENGLSLNK